jgi:Glycosyl hydrolase family 53
MKRLLTAVLSSVPAVALLAFATTVYAESGVNLTNGDRLSAAAQAAAIAQLKANHATIIRIPLEQWNGSTVTSVNLAANAVAAGLQVHLIITLSTTPVYGDAAMRPYNSAYPSVWAAYPLSQLSQAQLYQWVASALVQLENAGGLPAALEIGNEINNPAFNGDFSVPGHDVVYGLADLVTGSTPESEAVAAGFQQYAQALLTVQQAVSASGHSIPVISAGLANPGKAGANVTDGLSWVAINDTLSYLRMYGLDSFVSAYGIHVYPWESTPVARLNDIKNNELTQCGITGIPCAITEWGFQLPANWTCPAPDAARFALTQEILSDFAQFDITEKLWYDWTSTSYGLWQCNALTGTGALVLSQP